MAGYRVFISSTIDDLREARAGVDEDLAAVEIFEVIRVETLPATGEPSRRVCLDEVASADALVLILGDRYGFVPELNNPEGLSVTHLEYREGKRLRKPIFAFVRDGATPDARLARLIQELSDFDHGVLRKKWASVEELRREVRRSLLFWIARRARDQSSHKDQQQVATELARFPEVGEFPIVVEAVNGPDTTLSDWRQRLFDNLTLECKRHLLPEPRLMAVSMKAALKSVLIINVRPTSGERFEATIGLDQKWRDEEKKAALSPHIDLDVAQTSEGAKFAAQVSLAFAFFAADDWSRCISRCLVAATNRSATHRSRAGLLQLAADVSALNKGERSSEVVRHILNLPRLESATVDAGILCLVAAQLRYEHTGAHYALEESELLAQRLLTEALSRNQTSPELLYNLARQSFKHSPSMALTFYDQLLQFEPSYDERWYFHRDLGLLHYQANHLRDAARHYDLACRLKSNDSELWRFAGDAHYYLGYWAESILRYERALEIESVEEYFLDQKLKFARRRIRNGVTEERNFQRKRSLGLWFSRAGARLAQGGHAWLARPLFTAANMLSDLDFEADKWLALYSNRSGRFGDAIKHLKKALAAIPEDPSVRLNLALNLIFLHKGEFAEEPLAHAKIAIFHGGPETRDRFRLSLVNTRNREDLCNQFEDIFNSIKEELEAWRERRKAVLAPQTFGQVTHIEWRP